MQMQFQTSRNLTLSQSANVSTFSVHFMRHQEVIKLRLIDNQ